MYASNEDEDWVYLHPTPPENSILGAAMNLVDDELYRSDSISSTELEHAQNDDMITNTDVLISSNNNSMNHLLERASSEDPILLPQDINISTIVDENDVLNTGFELSKTSSLTNSSESLSLPNNFRSRNGSTIQQTDLCSSEITQSTPIYYDFKPRKRIGQQSTKPETLISCTCMIVILTLPFILGSIVTRWDQTMINKITNELDKTNRRLNELKDIPTGNIEEKLVQRLEEKLQNMIHQQLTWHEHEKNTFIFQIRELRDTLNITETNLTDTIHQLTDENEQLKEKIKLIENRVETTEEQYPKTCSKGVNCTKSSKFTLDKLVTNIFKRTASIAADTSLNLSGLFEHLSASVSKIVDHRYNYIKESKQKLASFTGSSTANKVQISFRRSVENISSSFRKAKLTYATWLKSRAQRREQIRMEQQTPKKFPWRWAIQRLHQTTNKNDACHSNFYFPINKIRSMKNWMVKFFRP